MELGASGQIAAAAREFQEAARLMPDMLEARLNWGLALAKEGQLEEARSEFEEVAARSPTNAVARHYLDLLQQHNQKGEGSPH
jgi:Flp pilus assembly protein TadD